MRHIIESLGGKHESSSVLVAMSGGEGSNKALRIVTHYDGGGWNYVEYLVEDHGKEESFSTFDAAVESYNEKP